MITNLCSFSKRHRSVLFTSNWWTLNVNFGFSYKICFYLLNKVLWHSLAYYFTKQNGKYRVKSMCGIWMISLLLGGISHDILMTCFRTVEKSYFFQVHHLQGDMIFKQPQAVCWWANAMCFHMYFRSVWDHSQFIHTCIWPAFDYLSCFMLLLHPQRLL